MKTEPIPLEGVDWQALREGAARAECDRQAKAARRKVEQAEIDEAARLFPREMVLTVKYARYLRQKYPTTG